MSDRKQSVVTIQVLLLACIAILLAVLLLPDLAGAASLRGNSDLVLTKSVDDASPGVGQRITFTVHVENRGEATRNVKIDDLIFDPNGCFAPTGIPQIHDGVGYGDLHAGFHWTIDLENGASATMTTSGTVDCATDFKNRAWISSSGSSPDPNGADNEAEVLVEPRLTTDLRLEKSVSHTSPVVGQRIQFTLTVSNLGDDTRGAVIRDLMVDPNGCFLPIGSAEVSTGVATNIGGMTFLWVLDLDAGETATLMQYGWAHCTTDFTNNAFVESGGSLPDGNPANNSARVAVVAADGKTTDLELTKIVDKPYLYVGDEFTYTINLSNNIRDDEGRILPTAAATQIIVKDYLPDGFTLLEATSGPGGSFDESTLTWSIPELGPGKGTSVSLRLRADDSGEYLNCAEVWDAAMMDRDALTGKQVGEEMAHGTVEDDQDCVSIWVGALLTDLELHKVVDNDAPAQEDMVTYTITVTNRNGDDGETYPTATATNIVIRDYLPAGLLLDPATVGTGTLGVTFDPDTMTWVIDELAPGKSIALSFRALVTGSGEYVNCAEVWDADQKDRDSRSGADAYGPLVGGPDAEDDQDCIALWATPRRPDLELHKIVSNDQPRPADSVTFSISLTNREGDNGTTVPTAEATNIVIREYLPDGLIVDMASVTTSGPNGISFNEDDFSWHIEQLGPGKTLSVSFEARVWGSGEIRNCAEVWDADQGDRDSRSGREAYGVLVGGPDGEDDQDCVSIWVDAPPVPSGSISGLVFFDEDHDGRRDHHEPGLAGFEVDLLEIGSDDVCGTYDDDYLESIDSNDAGAFTFWDVEVGDYCVRIQDQVVPYGYARTTAKRVPVTVPSGTHVSGVYFGFKEVSPYYEDPPEDDPLCYLTSGRNLSAVPGSGVADALVGEIDGETVQAVAYHPWSEVLFATDGQRLGRIDPTTGGFTPIGAHGTAGGLDGLQSIETMHGLTFDPFSARLFGTVRRSDAPDLLVELDPATGAAIVGSFGPLEDYVPMNGDLADIEDIAINPADGVLYAAGTSDGLTASMARIDRRRGSQQAARDLPTTPLSGLSFFNNGTLYGATSGPAASLITIDPITISISIEATLTLDVQIDIGGGGSGGGSDDDDSGYGGLDCLTGAPNRVSTTLFTDGNSDGAMQDGENGYAGVEVQLFRDVNGDGLLDTGDLPVAVTHSNAAGSAEFATAASGEFLMQVVASSLPEGIQPTTTATLAAQVAGFGAIADGGTVALPAATATDSESLEAELPATFALHGNYPNPFNPQTRIAFDAPEAGQVRLTVFDVLGRQVAVLVDGPVNAGTHEVVFDAHLLPSGTYFARLATPTSAFTKPMILVK